MSINSNSTDVHSESELLTDDEPVSKSEKKRQAAALQKVGKRLAELRPDQLAQFDLPEQVVHAINEYNRFKSNEAKRRQLQFIGKHMRQLPMEPILEHLDVLDGQAASVRQELHQLEQWRSRLIEENQALTEFIDAYPNSDRQQLRNLVKKARTEAQRPDQGAGHPHAKKLLRELRKIMHDE